NLDVVLPSSAASLFIYPSPLASVTRSSSTCSRIADPARQTRVSIRGTAAPHGGALFGRRHPPCRDTS
ncbi:hypothetical protein FOL47_002467, partial [Perkinsus chesapeaki]